MNRDHWAHYFGTIVLLAAAVFLYSCAKPGGQGVESQRDLAIADPSTLDAILDQYVGDGYYPFLYARLEDRNGRVIYEHAAVNDEILPGVAVDGDTWIRIWSMSKIVTISVALDLVEDGLLNLNDPVSKYIPEFAGLKVAVSRDGADLIGIADRESACPLRLEPMTAEMSVLDLINHQAGFYYATTGIPCLDSLVASKNLPKAGNSQDFVDLLAELPLIQQPGTHDYYGTNTSVLGIVLERATGKDLKQLVEERVTSALGIEGLQYGRAPAARLLPRVSGQDKTLREAQPGELDIFGPDVPDYDLEHELYLGGEGMLGTADGYADFLRMLLNRGQLDGHRFLDVATVEDIASPHTQLNNPYGYNGYNLWVNNGKLASGEQGEGGLWIGGGYEGTHFWIDPGRGFVAVIMTQMFWVPESGWGRDEVFREAVYDRLIVDGRRVRP